MSLPERCEACSWTRWTTKQRIRETGIVRVVLKAKDKAPDKGRIVDRLCALKILHDAVFAGDDAIVTVIA